MQGWCSACPHWAWNTIFVHTFQSEKTLKSLKPTLDLRRRFLSVFGPVSHQQVISVAWLFQSLRTIYNRQPAIQVKPQSPLPGTRKNWGELTSDTGFVTRAFLTSRACPQILTISKNFGWFGKIYISDNVIWKGLCRIMLKLAQMGANLDKQYIFILYDWFHIFWSVGAWHEAKKSPNASSAYFLCRSRPNGDESSLMMMVKDMWNRHNARDYCFGNWIWLWLIIFGRLGCLVGFPGKHLVV